jgi:hypothetical protein
MTKCKPASRRKQPRPPALSAKMKFPESRFMDNFVTATECRAIWTSAERGTGKRLTDYVCDDEKAPQQQYRLAARRSIITPTNGVNHRHQARIM